MKTFSYFSGLDDTVKKLVTVQGFLAFQWGVIQLIFPIYFAKLGFGGGEVGVILTASQLTAALMSIPFGVLADRHGRKRIVSVGAVSVGVAFFLYSFVTNYSIILLVSLFLGLASSMVFGPLSAWLADTAPHEKRNAVFSLGAAATSFTTTVSSLLGWIPPLLRAHLEFDELDSYKPVVAAPALMAFAAGILLSSLSEKTGRQTRRSLLPKKSIQVMLRISLVNALVAFGAGLVIPLFSLWFYLKFSVDEAILAPLYAISNLTLLFSFLLAPKLADEYGTVKTITTSQAAATLLLLTMPLVPSYPVVGLLFLMRTLLMNMVNPLITSLVLGATDPDERATVSGVISVSWNIPNSATPSIGGHIMQNVSLDLPFYICGAFYAAAVTLFYMFFRGKDSSSH